MSDPHPVSPGPDPGDRSGDADVDAARPALAPEILARYVPEEFRPRLDLAPGTSGALSRAESIRVVGRLTDLLSLVSMYIPSLALADRLARPDAPAVSGGFVHATTLYADISGFTPLTEKLARAGSAGAEEITVLMNSFFGAMVDILHAHGGCLLNFGGDSLLALFPYEAGAVPSGSEHDTAPMWTLPRPDAVRAAACALAMRAAMPRFATVATSAGPARLEMSIGVAAGPVFSASVGIPGERLDYLVTGNPIYQSAAAEAEAGSGDVLLTGPAAYLLGRSAALTRAGEGFFRLDQCRAAPPPVPAIGDATAAGADLAGLPLAARVDELVRRIEVLRPYLPESLFRKLEADPGYVQLAGENRIVTAVFAHLVGVGALLEAWGPAHVADLIALLDDYFVVVHKAVAKYRGFLARIDAFSKGDKLLVLFGTPVAQENDEECALRCALEINAELARLNARHHTHLAHRTGVNTGFAFCGNAGSLLRKEYTVMGDDVNLAARMMGRAADSQILAGPQTAARAQKAIDFGPPEPMKFKGKDGPVLVAPVVRARPEAAAGFALDLQANATRRLERTCGRETELAALDAALAALADGRGGIVLLTGEPGIGKSHLVRELVRRSLKAGAKVFAGQGTSHGRGTAYLPWLGVLQGFFGLPSDEAPAARAARLRRAIADLEPTLLEWAPLVAGVLGLAADESPALAALDPQLRKERLFDVLVALLRKAARRTPLLLVFEDAGWIDDLSLELVAQLAHSVVDAPVLAALAARPDRDLAIVSALPGTHALRLGPIAETQCLALARGWNGGADIPTTWRATLLARANGNPLFLRECLLALRASASAGAGAGAAAARAEAAVPDSLAGLLLARVDRLSEPERTVLRAAAVLGPRFELSRLAALLPLADERAALRDRIEVLCRQELLERESPGSDPTFGFRQTLLQQAVYDTLPRSARVELHARVVAHLESAEAARLDRACELLAYHCERAEQPAKLRHYLIRSGEKAQRACANAQACESFGRAVALFEAIPPERLTPAEAADLFGACRNWSQVLRIVGQYAEGAAVLERAGRAAGARQDVVAAREALLLLGDMNFLRAEYAAALRNAEEVLRRAGGDPATLARAFNACGQIYRAVGDHDNARKYVRKSYELLKRVGDQAKKDDLCRTYQGLASVYLDEGLPETAVKCLDRALEAARGLGDRAEIARVLLALGKAQLLRCEYDPALKACTEALDLATGIGYRAGTAATLDHMGRVSLRLGRPATAISYFRKALDALARIGGQAGRAEVLAHLVEGLTLAGDYDEALATGEESLRIARAIGDAGRAAKVRVAIAAVLARRARDAEAGEHLAEALAAARKAGDKYTVAAALRLAGELSAGRGELAEAERLAAEALALCQEIGDKDGVVATLIDQGMLWIARARDAEAEPLLKDALARAERLKARTLQARALAGLGRLAGLRNRFVEAEAFHRTALDLCRQAKDKAGTAAALLGLSETLGARGDAPAALAAAREGHQLCAGLAERRGVRAALVLLAGHELARGAVAEATALIDQAAAAADEMGDALGRAEAEDLRGQLCRRTGRSRAAAECHTTALEIARTVGSPRHEIAALDRLGACRAALGDLPEAASLHQAALELARELGDERAGARILVNLSRVHTALSNYDQAIPLLRQALACAQSVQDRSTVVSVLVHLGELALCTGRLAEAFGHFAGAEDKARAAGDADGAIAAGLGLGEARLKTGELQPALESLARASLAASEPTAGWARRCKAQRLMGVYHRLAGDYGRAGDALAGALAGLRELGELGLEIDTLADLGELALELGARDEARGHLRRAEELARRAKAIGHLHRVSCLAAWADLAEPGANPHAADRRLAEALNVASAVRAAEWVIEARAGLGLARALAGDFGAAGDLVEKAVTQATDRGYRILVPRLLGTAARVNALAGEAEAAATCVRQGLVEAERIGSKGLLWPLHAALGEQLAARDEAAGARREYGRAAELVRELAATILRPAERAAYLAAPRVKAVLERGEERIGGNPGDDLN